MQATVQREADVRVTDHVEVEVRLLPILEPELLDAIVREELDARGWTREPDGSLSKQFGDAMARLPAGSSTITLAVEDQRSVHVTANVSVKIAEGDVAAREVVAARAEVAGDRKLADATEAARAALVQKSVDRLLGVYDELHAEITATVNASTKRALEQRATELGSIDSIHEGRASDGSYELAITVRT